MKLSSHRDADVLEFRAIQVVPGRQSVSTIEHLAHSRSSIFAPLLVVEIVQNDEKVRHPKSHRVEPTNVRIGSLSITCNCKRIKSSRRLPEHTAELEEIKEGNGANIRTGEQQFGIITGQSYFFGSCLKYGLSRYLRVLPYQ